MGTPPSFRRRAHAQSHTLPHNKIAYFIAPPLKSTHRARLGGGAVREVHRAVRSLEPRREARKQRRCRPLSTSGYYITARPSQQLSPATAFQHS